MLHHSSDTSRYPSRPGSVSASAGSGFTANTALNGQGSVSTYSGLFGSFGGGSSGYGFGEGGSFGSFGRSGSDTIKSDYDQERLLQQLLHSESLHVRVKKGAGPAVNLLTPWVWPDKKRLPRVPVWSVECNKDKDNDRDDDNDDDKDKDRDKEKEREKEKERDMNIEREGKFPEFIPTIDEMIDLSGSRYNTHTINKQTSILLSSILFFIYLFFLLLSF